jgi:YhcH/YjgK/YiaL family protein
MEQTYVTRVRQDCFFESHLKHIDVQFMLEGDEWIDVISIDELSVAEAYREEKDLIKYHEYFQASRLRLRTGYVAVFFPQDGHMPGQATEIPGAVRKSVIKVPVSIKC